MNPHAPVGGTLLPGCVNSTPQGQLLIYRDAGMAEAHLRVALRRVPDVLERYRDAAIRGHAVEAGIVHGRRACEVLKPARRQHVMTERLVRVLRRLRKRTR